MTDKVQCLECLSVGEIRFFDTERGLYGNHFRKFHKDITREEYAEKYLTNERIRCDFCHKDFFKHVCKQRKTNYCCNRCAGKATSENLRNDGYYESETHRNTVIARASAGGKAKQSNIKTGKSIRSSVSLVKINLLSVKYKCKLDRCYYKTNFPKEFGKHLKEEHNITCAKYAEDFRTNEWIVCPICEKFHYCTQYLQSVGKTCCCKECAIIKTNKTKKEHGYYLSESFREARKKARKSFVENPKNRGKAAVERSKKAVQTKKDNNFYESEKFLETQRKIGESNIRSGVSRLISIKRQETMRKKGNCRISNGETSFSLLLEKLHEWNVLQQIKIGTQRCKAVFGNIFDDLNKQLELDFVLINKRALSAIIVCFDGIFFHGLDRPITEIARESLTSRFNLNIFNGYYSDRAFEEYCQKRNINLVRFDEISFKNFLFKKSKLQPYFSCGTSKELDFLFYDLGIKK